MTRPEDRISLKQKSAYAVGMLVNNLQAAALPAMMVILNLGMGMDVLLVGLIGSIPRIFDAVSDPMMGYISDNTRSRWGRRRPYIFWGAITAGIIFAVMWQLPSGYIDFMRSKPAKPHQIVTKTVSDAVTDESGAVSLIYDAAIQSDYTVVLHGPADKTETLPNGLFQTDLDGFPQAELAADLPNAAGLSVLFHESKAVSQPETYRLDLLNNAEVTGGGKLYRFQMKDLKLDPASPIEGDKVPNLSAMNDVSLEIRGVEGEGTAVIQSMKLRKGESFFTGYFAYFLTMSILFFLAYTVYATPFVAFGYEMTPDYHERTRLHAFANTAGQLAWLGVPWFYAIMSSSLFRDTVHGARTLAVAVGIAVAALGIIPAIFLRERQVLEPVTRMARGVWSNTKEFFRGMATTFKCKPFLRLCGATFLVFNGFQLGASFSIYIMIYYLFNGSDAAAGKLMGWFGMLSSIATLVIIPLTGWIATRMGKRRTFLITISLSLIGYAMKWFGYNPAHPYWLLFAAPLVAFGTGSLFTLMGSMISDVCDYDELETHQRREGVFGAIYWWMVKIGMSIAGLMTGILLKVSKFDQALGSAQSQDTMFLLRVFDVTIPLITSAIAIWIIAFYTLSEDKVYEIRTILEARRAAKKDAQSASLT